jgi:hypothetical protein
MTRTNRGENCLNSGYCIAHKRTHCPTRGPWATMGSWAFCDETVETAINDCTGAWQSRKRLHRRPEHACRARDGSAQFDCRSRLPSPLRPPPPPHPSRPDTQRWSGRQRAAAGALRRRRRDDTPTRFMNTYTISTSFGPAYGACARRAKFRQKNVSLGTHTRPCGVR